MTWIVIYIVGVLVFSAIAGFTNTDSAVAPFIMAWPICLTAVLVAAPCWLAFRIGRALR